MKDRDLPNKNPIAPLMIEHRVIERMVRLMKGEMENMRSTDSAAAR